MNEDSNLTILNTGNQTNPDVAMSDDGSFVVTWQSSEGGNQEIYAQIFDPEGGPFDNPFIGPFSRLLGNVQIELIQALGRKGNKVYENRFWGDTGFIHLCFDVPNMNALKANLLQNNYEFTVDSGDTFDMGESGGRFAYVEDPDGTLIEMVETHKVPVYKKLGLYMNLKNRKSNKPLPDWMVGLLGLNKVKE